MKIEKLIRYYENKKFYLVEERSEIKKKMLIFLYLSEVRMST